MDQHEMDEEYLHARARMERRTVTAQQEDTYNARIRTLVKLQNAPAARRIAFDEVIGI